MSYYFIANIRIHDSDEYQKYIKGSESVFMKFSGKYLAVDNRPELLEGQWNYSRSVIIEFPSKEEFNRWYLSPEYQGLLKHRLAAAECDTILVRGEAAVGSGSKL
jgi:uncharacterized protein (DUF1330 family)